ncbi:hypothetical protein [Actinotalea sp. JY-7876]|uniref:hypothetical protein n=1 Tax=Actinotalea sp. JY-7876 TaxID=2758442 RepID=UPI0015F64F62|nr:hypothetical protein [Actinotalea sp. JY-7876]
MALTVTDLQRWLRMTDNDPAAGSPDLDRVLKSAIGIVEARVGALSPQERVYRVRARSTALLLPGVDWEAVVAVTAPDGTEIPVSDLDVDLDAGIVHVPRALSGEWSVTATPAAPPPTAAASLEQAVLIVAAHLWKLQQGSADGGARIGQMPGSDAPPQGFAVPARAAELMRPYERVGGFA